MAGVHRPRPPERTVLYRVLFHYFDRFLSFVPCQAPGGVGRVDAADFRLFCRQERLVGITPTAKLCLTSFLAIFYTSSRWLEGTIKAKMRPHPAEPKNQIAIFVLRRAK